MNTNLSLKAKKNNGLLKIAISLSVAFVLTVGLRHYQDVEPTRVEAEQHLANYDLYTYSGSYYDGIDFDAAGGMNGALRESLTSLIIPKGFYTYGKTGETHLATQLQYADEDPTNSNNMVYLYTRDSVTKNAAQSWNREHVWCQSLSNGNWGTSEGGTDILHLRPTYGSVNSSRGNTPYGDTNKATAKKYNNMLYGYTGGGYFEPIDAVKGDVARIVMYVWTTYTNYKDYSALDILDVFQSYNTLLSWHTMDKPDVLEGNRNDYCQTSRQKNRNPFVDHPELAWKIFGNNVSDSVKNACMAAYPAESGGSGEPTGIRLNKTTASVEAGKTLQLTATIEPAGATGTVSWSTNNSSVATVSSGLVTTKAEGMATITASVGGFSASCAVNVTAAGSINYGTEDNPISVADAIEIIDKTGASETAQPLYVRGIVSSNTALDANYNDYEIWLKNDDDNVAEAFNLYHVKADSSITSVYQDANSLKDFEVVAYGYGKKYNNTTYELTTSSRTPKNPSLLSVSPPEATGIAFDQYSVELEAGETTTITVTLTPSNSESTINWTSSNESVATVSNGVITAVAAGSAVITASVSDDVEEECYVTVTGGQSELVKVASYDFSTGNTATSEYDSSGLLARFTSSAASGTGLSDIVDDVTSLTKVYAGFTGYTEFGIKFGTKGNSGSFTLSLNKEVTRVVVNTSGWGASDSLTIGDADPQVPGVAYTGTNPIKTLSYDITSSDSVEFVYADRGFVQSIEFYAPQSGAYTVTDYLNNASSIATLHANEDVSTGGEVTISKTVAQVSGTTVNETKVPTLTLDSVINVSVNPDGNNGKVYGNGTEWRLYQTNNAQVTVSAARNASITSIKFTFTVSNSGVLKYNDVAITSGTAIAINSLSSAVFTVGHSGSGTNGQIRVSAIEVTYNGAQTSTIDNVAIRFGAEISQADWNAIDNQWGITDYGVMLLKKTTLDSYGVSSIQNAFLENNPVTIIRKGSNDAPYLCGDNYVIKVKVNIANDASYYDDILCAATFIVIGDEYYFLEEKQYSVNTLAEYYRTNGGSTLSDAALEYLETTHS